MGKTDANAAAICQRSCHAVTEYQCDAVCRRRFTSADVRRSETDLLLGRANAVCGVASLGCEPQFCLRNDARLTSLEWKFIPTFFEYQ
jgi:hypothetical protein